MIQDSSGIIYSHSWRVLPICDPGLPAPATEMFKPLLHDQHTSTDVIVVLYNCDQCLSSEDFDAITNVQYSFYEKTDSSKTITTSHVTFRALGTTSIHILGLHASLALTLVGLRPFFNSDGLNLNETRRISWLKAAEFIHGRLLLVI